MCSVLRAARLLSAPRRAAPRRSLQLSSPRAPPPRPRRSAACAIFLPRYASPSPACDAADGCPTRRDPLWDRVLDVPPAGLWRVPWRAPTVVLRLVLWGASYVLAARLLDAALLAGGLLAPGVVLGDRALALYSLAVDALECAATALVLRWALSRHWPLPPGWFAFDVRGAARHWRLLLAACATFPLLTAATSLAYDALGGAAAPDFWEGASVAALRAGSCDAVALCTYVASHALLAPLWEETVFRGLLVPSLCRYLPAHGAVFVSALLFAAAHRSALAPGLLLLGVLLGGVYVRTRSLAAPVALHALWNLHSMAALLFA